MRCRQRGTYILTCPFFTARQRGTYILTCPFFTARARSPPMRANEVSSCGDCAYVRACECTHARVYVYTRCTVMAIHYQPFTTNHYQSLSLTSTHYQSLALSTNHYQSLALTSTHYQSLLTLVCMSNTGSQLGQSELEPNGTAERALLFASALTSLGSMGAEWRY